MLSPAKPSSMSPSVIVNRTQGLTVTWTGGGSSQVRIFLGGGTSTSIQCEFAATAGAGTIPSSTLASLPAGMGIFSMGASGKTTFDAGDWRVDLQSYYDAVWPDGAIVSGVATLQ